MAGPWKIRALRDGLPSGRLSVNQSTAPPSQKKSKIGWHTLSQNAAHIATVVAAVVSLAALYIAWRAIDFQRLENEYADTRYKQEAAARDAQDQRLRATQLEMENSAASVRLADIEEREEMAVSQLLLADAELRRRTQDVADAHDALNQVRAQTVATEAARQLAVRNLVSAQLAATVTAHLRGVQRLRRRNEVVMLADVDDLDFPNKHLIFEVFPNRSTKPAYPRCRLSGPYEMRLFGPTDLDPGEITILDALCSYLKHDTGTHTLSDVIRGDDSQDVRSMMLWEWLGHSGPFVVEIRKASDIFETESIQRFWSDLDAYGFLMVPGARAMLLEENVNNADKPEIEAFRLELDRFMNGWHDFVQTLPTISQPDESYSDRSREGPVPLGSVRRTSLASLRDTSATPTQGFESRLLCAAAWYAQRSGLIEAAAREDYCASY